MKFETKTRFFATVAFAAVLIASGVMEPFKVDESLGMMTPCEAVLNDAVHLLASTLNPNAQYLIGLCIFAVAVGMGNLPIRSSENYARATKPDTL
jgi:hypothetical protein